MSELNIGHHYPFNFEELPKHWSYSSIGDVALEMRPGFASGKHNQEGSGVPHLRPMNISRYGIVDLETIKFVAASKSDLRLTVGDVLFNNTNSPALVGKTAAIQADEDWAFSNHMTRIRFPGSLNSKFVAHQLHFLWMHGYFRHMCVNHVNQASVSTNKLRTEVPLLIAPLPEQKRIVSKIEELFSDLDAGVAALERARANLRRYRASVLKSAVEGRLTAAWRLENPDVEPASQLLTRILTERRQRWEQQQLATYEQKGKKPPKNWQSKYKEPAAPDTTNLPPLPTGWCWATIDAIGEVVGGITKGQKRNTEEELVEVPYLRVANVQRGYLDLSEIKSIQARASEVERYRLQPGDILFNEGGDRDKLGRGWVWEGQIDDCIHQNHVFRVRLVLPEMNSEFVSHHGNTFGRLWFLRTGKQSVNLASINMTVLRQFPVPLAPLTEQSAIIELAKEKLAGFDQSLDFIEKTLFRSDRLRQSILKSAFEGKLVEPASASQGFSRKESRNETNQCSKPAGEHRTPSQIMLRRTALASYIVNCLHDQPSFGRTQLAKAVYLTQSYVDIDLDINFARMKAGPFHKCIYPIENLAKREKWFTWGKNERPDVTKKIWYEPSGKIDEILPKAMEVLGEKRAKLDQMLAHFKNFDTDQAELVATVFAVWNDMLIEKQKITQTTIVSRFFGWHESKKKFSKNKVVECVRWLKTTDLKPLGLGRVTTKAEGKLD